VNPFKKVFNRFLNFVAPKTKHEVVVPDQHYSIPSPKPRERKLGELRKTNRYTDPHQTGFGTFTRLKHIGGHPVRHLGRAFKEAFEREYGVKLR
jgi:hypothetical protein